MLIGNWIINFFISVVAFLIAFIGSMATNSLATSLFRGSITFIIFFIISYFFRWLWMIASSEAKNIEDIEPSLIEVNDEGKNLSKEDYTDEEIAKASQYVKDLIND